MGGAPRDPQDLPSQHQGGPGRTGAERGGTGQIRAERGGTGDARPLGAHRPLRSVSVWDGVCAGRGCDVLIRDGVRGTPPIYRP